MQAAVHAIDVAVGGGLEATKLQQQGQAPLAPFYLPLLYQSHVGAGTESRNGTPYAPNPSHSGAGISNATSRSPMRSAPSAHSIPLTLLAALHKIRVAAMAAACAVIVNKGSLKEASAAAVQWGTRVARAVGAEGGAGIQRDGIDVWGAWFDATQGMSPSAGANDGTSAGMEVIAATMRDAVARAAGKAAACHSAVTHIMSQPFPPVTKGKATPLPLHKGAAVQKTGSIDLDMREQVVSANEKDTHFLQCQRAGQLASAAASAAGGSDAVVAEAGGAGAALFATLALQLSVSRTGM